VRGGSLQVGKAAGEKWRSMTEEEKKPYVDQAKELKAKFASGEGSAVIFFLDPTLDQSLNSCALLMILLFICLNLTVVSCLVSDGGAGEQCRRRGEGRG
jgi:hypothetical protein